MKPAFQDDWATVYSVDALTGASLLPEKSVHTIITSPPYWNLRSYLPSDHPDKAMELGAEPTPELYVERLVEVFRALRRVLRDEGQLWINLGDSYAANRSYQVSDSKHKAHDFSDSNAMRIPPGLKSKDLVGIPWMVAFALRSDGWYLRSDIIWSKPSCMPESVNDRPTKSHEYMFLLTKSPRYFFDQEAVREPQNEATLARYAYGFNKVGKGISENGSSHTKGQGADGGEIAPNPKGRNIRSVWNIATRPYPGSHYAVFPLDLVYPCIKAGSSEYGVCTSCLAPWERVVERKQRYDHTTTAHGKTKNGPYAMQSGEGAGTHDIRHGIFSEVRTVGWQPTCSCDANTTPATVLDPFVGSGTTALAARKLGRRSIGFDLDERNIKQIEERLGWQGVLL